LSSSADRAQQTWTRRGRAIAIVVAIAVSVTVNLAVSALTTSPDEPAEAKVRAAFEDRGIGVSDVTCDVAACRVELQSGAWVDCATKGPIHCSDQPAGAPQRGR
jgi:hypothetical protein